MTDLRKAAEMVLEALDTLPAGTSYKTHNAASALRRALRQALAEPDIGIDRGAWADVPDATKWVDELRGGDETEEEEEEEEPVAFVCRGKLSTIGHCEEWQPLYTAPPKRDTESSIPEGRRPEWVGLTDDEFTAIARKYSLPTRVGLEYFKDELEAKLKEKNT